MTVAFPLPVRYMLSKAICICILILPLSAQDEPTDYLPRVFHSDRRDAVRDKLPTNSVAVFFANPIRNRANDVDYVYHQDPDFYYLTGYREPHSILLIFSDWQLDDNGKRYNEIIFVQDRDPFNEMWNGRRLGVEGVKEKLGFNAVREHSGFKDYSLNFSKFDKVLFFDFKNDERDQANNEADLYDLKEQFRLKAAIPGDFNGNVQRLHGILKNEDLSIMEKKQQLYRMSRWNPRALNEPVVQKFMQNQDVEVAMKIIDEIPETPHDVGMLETIMSELREIKTEAEMKLLRRAIDISCVGQVEVMKAMHPEMSETEVQGIHEFVFKKYGAEFEGYPSIVGAGRNGCVLHYITNNKPRLENDLVLMDLGAEYHGYTADVTRTIPADGTFSNEQKTIYNIVLEAQQAGFEQCLVGNNFSAPHIAAKEVIDRRLVEIGLVAKGEDHFYFPHGTSHYLGLDVHDRGTYGPFKHNTVITVEPGIYIPEGSPCDPKWWGIAVRIEDDVLITDKGWVNLSARAPRSVEEIERVMAQPSALDDFVLPVLDAGK